MDKQLEKTLARLETLLQEQIQVQEQMLELLRRKHAALRGADPREITVCCQEENLRVQRLSELEKQRLELVARATLMVLPGAVEPLRMDQLALRLEEPARGRLLVLREQLRQRIEQVRREADVTRRATESLARHMQGLIQKISAACTGIAVYGHRGAPPRAALAVSTFSATA